MLIVATDILSCPRCGPDFGLVVLADRLEHRRVLDGSLGCANCRETFPIVDGLSDLRYPPHPATPPEFDEVAGDTPPDERALRVAALLGVTGGPGVLLVAGDQARLAGEITALVPEIGVVAVGPAVVGQPDREGVSRILNGAGIPLRSGTVRGVALTGPAAQHLLEEGLRVLLPGARIVLDPAPESAAARLAQEGCAVLLDQDHVVVASRSSQR